MLLHAIPQTPRPPDRNPGDYSEVGACPGQRAGKLAAVEEGQRRQSQALGRHSKALDHQSKELERRGSEIAELRSDMVAGFHRIEHKFERIDHRFERVEGQLSAHDALLHRIPRQAGRHGVALTPHPVVLGGDRGCRRYLRSCLYAVRLTIDLQP